MFQELEGGGANTTKVAYRLVGVIVVGAEVNDVVVVAVSTTGEEIAEVGATPDRSCVSSKFPFTSMYTTNETISFPSEDVGMAKSTLSPPSTCLCVSSPCPCHVCEGGWGIGGL